jgi:alpha-glucuronidase
MDWCSTIVVSGQTRLLKTAEQELIRGLDSMIGVLPGDYLTSSVKQLGRIVLGVAGSSPVIDHTLAWSNLDSVDSDGYVIHSNVDEQSLCIYNCRT